MPDMTGRPRGISCHPVSNNLYCQKDSMEEDDIEKAVNTRMFGQHRNRIPTESNDDDELQKAIALSLQTESDHHASANLGQSMDGIDEDDLARALAESIADIESRQKVKASGDCNKTNVEDFNKLRRKDGNWPVGLQNIGNTCWFNVVVQSLFHLPQFRSLVLKFSPPFCTTDLSSDSRKSLQLVQELRSLFALMVASKRSYIDPTRAVNIFQEAFLAKNNDSQQDASEFIHMLLDQLEEAFCYERNTVRKRSRYSSSSSVVESYSHDLSDDIEVFSQVMIPVKHPLNPMLDLFYGTSKTFGVNNGNNFEQEHSFGILPLCVKDHHGLHDSLDYATSKGHQGAIQTTEVWITRLPPVLTFQLSRFNFNQNLGRPEKIHDRFSFPSILYMDRYMEGNKEITRKKRDIARSLQLQRLDYKAKLGRLLNYPNNGNLYSLTEALSCCAEYASEQSTLEHSKPASPAFKQSRRRLGSGSPSDGLSPTKRLKDENTDGTSTSQLFVGAINTDLSTSPMDGSDLSIASSMENEAQMVESVLRRWKVEVEKEISDLRTKLMENNTLLERLFEEPELHNYPYCLHAVLVHQGQAVAGHYWAYIRDHTNQRWLKFNDTSVVEATFEQLNRDSLGVNSLNLYDNFASAYCLIYIDSKRMDLFRGKESLSEIPLDSALTDLVYNHNQQFDRELRKRRRQDAKSTSFSSDQTGDRRLFSDKEMETTTDGTDAWNLNELKGAIERVGATYNGLGVEKALEEAVQDEMKRMKKLSQDPDTLTSDPRLLSIVIYMYQNNVPVKLIERCVLEQFTDTRLKYERRSCDIMRCAASKLRSLSPDDLNEETFKVWKFHYQSFCAATCHLVRGLELFQGRKYFDAIQHFVAAQELNNVLIRDGEVRKGVDSKLISRYCRTSIQRVHEEAAEMMRSDDEKVALKGLKMMRKKLIPCMSVLLSTSNGGGKSQDLQLADTIRDDWCSFIEQNIVVPREQLSDALTEFLDANVSSCASNLPSPQVKQPSDLSQLYERVMTLLQQPPV